MMNGNATTAMRLIGKVRDIPSIDGTLTKSGQAADAKTVGDKLNELREAMLDGDDVINNLESEDTDKPLSAAMGKALNERVNQSGGGHASGVIYDNSESNLDAHDVQYAITLLASMIGDCLPLIGGTMTGENIYMDSGNVRIQGNENALWMQALNGEMDNDNRRLLALYNSNFTPDLRNAVVFEDITNGKKNSYPLLGAHNKRSGNFTGTGAGAEIQTDSLGYAVLIAGLDSNAYLNEVSIVSPAGAVRLTTAGIGFFPSMGANFMNGKIHIATPMLNESGKNYVYYVL